MSFEHIVKTITGDAPGQSFELNYYRIGPANASTKVFLQASLHADEQPGMMVLHHLLNLLREADGLDKLNAEFVVFPMANPIGMANIEFCKHQGRYHAASGVNFNRQWPDLFVAVNEKVSSQLGDNADENIRLVRQAVSSWLDKLEHSNSLEKLRHVIMTEAYNSDYVLDLHCDNDALKHIFISPDLLPEFTGLSDWFGAAATLTSKDSGGGSFDEVWSGLWTRLNEAHPDKNVPHACCAATLEYRGVFDVFDDINLEDAENLYGFFHSRSLINGSIYGDTPEKAPDATELEATEMLRVSGPGLLAYKVQLGDKVKKGDVIADLIALDGENAFVKRSPQTAGTDGLVISRNTHKYVWNGCSIAKIVGTQRLSGREGYLLED